MKEQELKLGIHVLVDAWGAPKELLNDPDVVRSAAEQAVAAAGATLINMTVHQFSPQGVTAVATLAESHFALHTWPEYGFFGLDIFVCGCASPLDAVATACELLGATGRQVREIVRSMPARIDLVGVEPQAGRSRRSRSPAA